MQRGNFTSLQRVYVSTLRPHMAGQVGTGTARNVKRVPLLRHLVLLGELREYSTVLWPCCFHVKRGTKESARAVIPLHQHLFSFLLNYTLHCCKLLSFWLLRHELEGCSGGNLWALGTVTTMHTDIRFEEGMEIGKKNKKISNAVLG